jgi:hypothetical protein
VGAAAVAEIVADVLGAVAVIAVDAAVEEAAAGNFEN